MSSLSPLSLPSALSQRYFSRRRFLGTVLGTTLGLLARPAVSVTRALGTARLTTLSDGYLTLPGNFAFGGLPQGELAPILAEFALSAETITPECNVTLYRDGVRTVLFDVGSGPDFMDSSGQLLDSLAARGVEPEDITHVVFTHAHPDHLWGGLDDFDELLFPEATFLMGRAEWDYWWNPQTVDRIGQDRVSFAVGAKRRLTHLEDRIELFDDGQEVLPGIAAVATPGHTPGHTSFEIRQGSESVMILGDAIGNGHLAFRKPHWPSGGDQDQEQGIVTRTALFERIVHEKMSVVGFHLPGGGMGRVETAQEGYRFVGEQS